MSLLIIAAGYGSAVLLTRYICEDALPFVIFLFAVVLSIVLYRRSRFDALRIRLPHLSGRKGLFVMLFLIVMPAVNILEYRAFADIKTVVLMAGAVSVEEIVFRGIILSDDLAPFVRIRYLRNASPLSRILISSALFALFHAVNIIGSPDIPGTLFQIFCAFCAGVLFAAVTQQTGSILPCTVCHFIINITSPETVSFSVPVMIGSAVCLAAGIIISTERRYLLKGN